MKVLAALVMAVPLLPGTVPTASIEVELAALRNNRGAIQACMTRDAAHFPDCKGDPRALKQTLPATSRRLQFNDIPVGRYALSVIHDENSNRKLDTMMGIPREGFGFSRNPVIRFGPPRFDRVSIELAPGFTRTSIRMQYLL